MTITRENLIISDFAETRPFKAVNNGGGKDLKYSPEDRAVHSARLKSQLESVWEAAERSKKGAKNYDGMYVDITGVPEANIDFKKFAHESPGGVRLLNTSTLKSDEKPVEKLTAFLPEKEYKKFVNNIESYGFQNTRQKGNPCNQTLVAPIDKISNTTVESLWTDLPDQMPGAEAKWCEVWLDSGINEFTDSGARDKTVENFRNAARDLNIQVGGKTLAFPERTVLLAKASYSELQSLIDSFRGLAEFRLASEAAGFWIDLPARDQRAWCDEFLSRLTIDCNSNVSICLLDSGINDAHKLLKPLMPDGSCMTIDPNWGTSDSQGHGTNMAGLAGYGELEPQLVSSKNIEADHFLESVKILPPKGENRPELYGRVTIDAFSTATINFPYRTRIGCMAISTGDNTKNSGRPSAWSAAIDNITSGVYDGVQKLFFQCAGNVDGESNWRFYPNSNHTSPIEDPGQSWNAITVGAYTNKITIKDKKNLAGFSALAPSLGLSPFSRTSLSWDGRNRPLKPEIVMEGGNVATKQGERFDTCDDLSLLTTSHHGAIGEAFTTINATSAATALAANLGAKIQAAYPNIWAETTRALIVHSARWTDQMKKRFNVKKKNINKNDYKSLINEVGYGIPDFTRAVSCVENSLTLVSEQTLHPFIQGTKDITMREMHLYELPWPRKELEELGDLPVKIRVTLSYFIEPAPGTREEYSGYNYASHQLQFYMNKPNETSEEFRSRINKMDEIEGVKRSGTYDRWQLGQLREAGSIHSDLWEGTAVEAATQNLIAVVPKSGWWKVLKKQKKMNNAARYSLIISIETDPCETDIYAVVQQKIANKTPIPIAIQI